MYTNSDRKNTMNFYFNDQYSKYYGMDAIVKTITFIVTHQCNLRCTYCYEHHKSDERMSLETAKKCIDFLFEEDAKNSELINSINANGIILDFIGGEPLLEIELIDNIVSYFLDKAIELNHRWAIRYMISMSTNGTLGDDPKVKEFLKKYDGRLSIGVTIDGDKDAHDACRVDCNGCGSYDKAIKMFREINKNNRLKSTKYTISPGNIDLFTRSCKHLIENEGIDILNCNCVFEEGWTIEHAIKLYSQLKEIVDYIIEKDNLNIFISILDWNTGYKLSENNTQNWCGGNAKMLCFDTDGTILPCMRFSKVSIGDNQPEYRIGDVYNGIANTEEDKERLELLKSITRQSQSEQKCLDCPINGGCAWCTAYNYEVTGTPNKRVTYICDMHKARVLAQCYYHNKLHLIDPDHKPKKMRIPREWSLDIISEDEYNMLLDLEKQAFSDIPEQYIKANEDLF